MSQGKKEPLVYVICGKIGSGKTTLCKNIAKGNKKILYIEEPVDLWEKWGVLKDLYKSFDKPESERYEPLVFQTVAFSSRLAEIKKKLDNHPDVDIIILDSFITIDKNVYAQKFIDEGLIKKEQMKYYDINYENWKYIIACPEPFRYFYLNTTSENCKKRQEERNRESEKKAVSLDYLKSFDKYFNAFTKKEDIFDTVIHIDGNREQHEVAKDVLNQIKKDLDLFQ